MQANRSMRKLVRKEVLISTLSETRQELLACAAAFSEEDSRRVFLGTWSLMDLLAHLTGWDHANIEAIQSVLMGRLPHFYKYHDRDWQGFNTILVRKHRLHLLEEQVAEAASSHLLLMEELGDVPPDAIDRDFGVRFRGYRVTIRRLMEGEGKDEAAHLAELRKFERSLHA